MAEKKITDLPESSHILESDFVEFVDTNSNTSKKITLENVAKSISHGDLGGLTTANDHPQYALTSHHHDGLYTTLVTPITSSSWVGGPFSSTPKTLIDLSVVFEGVPAGIQAVYVKAVIKDSGSANADCRMILSPNNVNNSGISFNALPINDKEFSMHLIVPCNPDGDIYYQIYASGDLTFAAWLSVWGWWI